MLIFLEKRIAFATYLDIHIVNTFKWKDFSYNTGNLWRKFL